MGIDDVVGPGCFFLLVAGIVFVLLLIAYVYVVSGLFPVAIPFVLLAAAVVYGAVKLARAK
jgi:hypothetical protein